MICKLFFFIKIKRYAADLKSAGRKAVGVQVPLRVPLLLGRKSSG